jgi:hypothetical protein
MLGQCPESADVIGQNANGDRFEGAALLNGAIDLSQTVNF